MTTDTAKPRGVFLGTAQGNVAVCREHYRLTLTVPAFPQTRPGQFVQVLCRPPGEQESWHETGWPADGPPKLADPELAGRVPLLRRPLSLAGRRDAPDDPVELTLIYRVIGTGTHWLASVQPGQELSVLGPLGNAFAIRSDKPYAALVGGGVGIPPMLYLAEALAAAGRRAVAFCGARSADLLPLRLLEARVCSDGRPTDGVEEFATCGLPASVATDDGSAGLKGFVSDALERWLDYEGLEGDAAVVYCCGPEALMQAVARLCATRKIECQLCMERHMACGMGTCQSCNVKVRADNDRGWAYKLCCTDGPVFDARDLVW